MKLLVTGGAGFIGSNFIHYWLYYHPEDHIFNLDKLTYAGNLENLKEVEDNPNYTFIKGDITDGKAVGRAVEGVDVVVHLAAESIAEDMYLPIRSTTGTRVLTFGELWEQQSKKNRAKETAKGEVIFLQGRQTRVLSFLNGGQWMKVEAITRHWYKGKIIKLSQKWGTIKATPNHSIYASNLKLTNPENNPELLAVRNINENNRKFKKGNRELLEIMAAYITEGNATFNKANGGYIIEIGQKDKQWLENIGKMIKKHFGYNYNISRGEKGKFTFYHLQVSNKNFFNYLVKNCGKYCDGKFFPNWIFDLFHYDREYFWQKLLEGDGTKDARYTTTSYKLVNQIGLLLALQNRKFTIFERESVRYKKSWEFKTGSGNHYGLNQRKKEEIDYEGWVYDLEVKKTHNFVCGPGNIVCHNTHVDRSILGPAIFVKTNVLGTQVLLEAALKHNVKHFHHISTDEVFGSLPLNADRKFNEESNFRPNSPYAASKASSDMLVRAYFKTYGLPVTITNTSNNFGPYQFPEKLIPLMIINALEGKPLPVYGDGKNVRDWLYVGDHCRAIEMVLEKGRIGETYCVGGNAEKSNLEVVKKILQILGKDESLIKFVKDRPGHDRRYAIDSSKATDELGYQPLSNFEEWLAKTVDWYVKNQMWWKNVMSKEYQQYYQTQYRKRLGEKG